MWYRPLVESAAKSYGIDPLLICAFVQTESSGQPSAYRFEPKFWERYLPMNPQWKGQVPERIASSYGLMQLMYPKAVELGFKQDPEYLFVPSINLDLGCRLVRSLLDWASGFPGTSPDVALRAAVAAYNGGKGGNQPSATPLRNGVYASRLLALRAKLV